MDDDFGWSSSVWDASDEASTSTFSIQSKPKISANGLDDPDGPFQSTPTGDDDFGDFGDFDDGTNDGFQNTFESIPTFTDDLDGFGTLDNNWRALRFHPMPQATKLREQVDGLLSPTWGQVDPSEFTTDEDLRQKGTLSQTLVTRER